MAIEHKNERSVSNKQVNPRGEAFKATYVGIRTTAYGGMVTGGASAVGFNCGDTLES